MFTQLIGSTIEEAIAALEAAGLSYEVMEPVWDEDPYIDVDCTHYSEGRHHGECAGIALWIEDGIIAGWEPEGWL